MDSSSAAAVACCCLLATIVCAMCAALGEIFDSHGSIESVLNWPARYLGLQLGGLTVALHVPHPQRIPGVLTWTACHATRLVMLVPEQHLSECRELCGRQCECNGGTGAFFVHKALTRLKLRSAALLFAHADFWLDIPHFIGAGHLVAYAESTINATTMAPKEVKGARALSRPHLGCMNFSAVASDREWSWPHDARKTCVAVAKSLGSDVCCVAWADAFYLPAREAETFVRGLALAAHVNLYHEAALPTLLHHAAVKGSTSGRRRRSERDGEPSMRAVRCAGSCCSSVSWREALDAKCGHRVGLQSIPAEARRCH